jgi:carboxyl-terminal processing protease
LSHTKDIRIRFLLSFLAGIIAAVLVATAASVGSSAATRYEELSLFTNVLTLVRRNYVEPVDERKLVRGAVRGMLSELDPHSSFMDADAYKEMQVDTKGEFHGLGIEISKTRDGYIQVVSPIEGTPAYHAGIKARDQIVAICPTDPPEDWEDDCHGTKSMTLFEAVNLMRGPKNTEITIEVYRDGFDGPKPFTIVRDVVKVVSVSGRMLEPGYAYVRLRAFQERTGSDLARVLARLHEEAGAPLDGLVIDVRDNPGGLLNQAVQVADVWLSDGLVVYTKGRVDGQRQEFRADAAGTEPSYPITVLVNEGTASASEIVAGALQDQGRALVVGKKSFGKGSVQTVYPLEGGNGLRLTTALYYTPGGRSIQEVGIVPDIAVSPAQPEDFAPEGRGRKRVREADLEGHFKHHDVVPDAEDEGSGSQPKSEDAAPEAEGEDSEPGAGASTESDVQLARALEVLKSWTYFERLKTGEKPETLQALSVDEEPTAATP